MAGAWAVLIPAAFWAAAAFQDRMVASSRIEGSESARTEDVLAGTFGSPLARSLLLTVRGLPPLREPAGAAVVHDIAAEIRAIPGVLAVLSPGAAADSLLLGREVGSGVFVVGFDPHAVRPDSLVSSLRALTEGIGARLRPGAPDISLRWTGVPALSRDLRHTSAAEARRSELRAMPLVLVLLLLAFRSVVAALVPLAFGILAIGVSLGAALIAASLGTPSILLGNVVSILGLALGVDYSLLTVTRFREGLADGLTPEAAGVYAVRNAGHTILLSGATVMLGFAGLLLVPIGELRSVGLGGFVVAIVAVALGTTLLPVVLSWIGPRIDWLRMGRAPTHAPGRGWIAWGRFVTAHPIAVLLCAGIPLALLTIPALRLSSAAPREDWLPRAMESARALQDLTAIGRPGLPSTLPVLVDLSGVEREGAGKWSLVHGITEAVAGDPRVAHVHSLTRLAADYGIPPELLLRSMPEPARKQLTTEDGRWARLDVVPAPNVGAAELSALVRDIRRMDDNGGVAPPGVHLLVGGIPAFQTDYEDAVRSAAPWVVASVLGSTLLVLAIGFRSLLIPVKATIMNLLTVSAALGSLVIVFQDGLGSGLLGIDTPLSGVFPAVPIMAFCIVFGLSMDYEVFLLGRIAELRKANPDAPEREAIIEGVARTARVITFAAGLMIVIFAAFAAGDYLPSKLFGFALAVAVLTDATLVRLAIGPALLQLAGQWNWWPGDRPRRRRGA